MLLNFMVMKHSLLHLKPARDVKFECRLMIGISTHQVSKCGLSDAMKGLALLLIHIRLKYQQSFGAGCIDACAELLIARYRH
mmetsp:Transcript_14129/g.17127  ORF Transcript_14129/g.17127 Transcript_14129/m.17127 type:complete len:82 (-) Transcript_14129:649-894(-)